MRSWIILAVVLLTLGSTGCVELAGLITGTPLDQNGGSPPDDNGEPPGDGTTTEVPQVTLAVSNSSPSANEEVALACRSVFGSAPATSFAFLPTGVLLDINTVAGTAVFLPSESVINTEFTFTCTGTNQAGTSVPSPAVTVIPIGSGL